MEINKIHPIARVTKTGLLLTSMIILSGSLFCQNDKKTEDAEIYGAIGMMFAEGSGLAKMKFTEEQIDLILAGMKKGISLGKMPPEAQALMPKVQQIMMEKMKIARAAEQEGMKGLAAENKAKSKEYLALLATDEKVKKDPSGFYYEILREGKGPSPTMKNTVRLHYHGTLIDGSVFDSSVDRGEPVTFPVNGVIPGWIEGLQLMKEGDKAEFVIPQALAYGPGGAGSIPPFSTLVFEVELLKVNP